MRDTEKVKDDDTSFGLFSIVGYMLAGFLLGTVLANFQLTAPSKPEPIEVIEDPTNETDFTTEDGLECKTVHGFIDGWRRNGISCNWEKWNREQTKGESR